MLAADLKKLLEKGILPGDAASQVLRGADTDELIEYAYPAVFSMARNIQRELNRKLEDDAFSAGDELIPPRPRRRTLDDRMSSVEKLGKAGFYVGGVLVGWLEATVEQHEIYIAMLRAMLRGIEVNIARHEWAIEVCRENGVQSLQEATDTGVVITLPDDGDWDASDPAVS